MTAAADAAGVAGRDYLSLSHTALQPETHQHDLIFTYYSTWVAAETANGCLRTPLHLPQSAKITRVFVYFKSDTHRGIWGF
jgi:hypothetical protein